MENIIILKTPSGRLFFSLLGSRIAMDLAELTKNGHEYTRMTSMSLREIAWLVWRDEVQGRMLTNAHESRLHRILDTILPK